MRICINDGTITDVSKLVCSKENKYQPIFQNWLCKYCSMLLFLLALWRLSNQSPQKLSILVNPFPHIDAFWRLCSRQLFEIIVTKEEIAQNKQFLLLPQCFPLLVIGYPFNYRDFLFLSKYTQSSTAELSYEGKG